MKRLELALKRMKISILHVLPNALYMGESVLVADEKEEGVAVVNIGAELTDVAVYDRNVVRYVATIPMGASAINRDIRSMGVPEKVVEDLKVKAGSAVADLAPEDKLLRLKGHTAREPKEIVVRNLAAAIEARATDIAEYVLQEIKDSGYFDCLSYGIVLTGGSAQLRNLDELFRRVTGMEVRVALPEVGFSEETAQFLDDPSYVTVTGLLLRGAQLGLSSVLVDRPAPAPEQEPAPAKEEEHPAEPEKPAEPVRPAETQTPAEPEHPAEEEQSQEEETTTVPERNPEDEELIEEEPKKKKSRLEKMLDKFNGMFSSATDDDDEEV